MKGIAFKKPEVFKETSSKMLISLLLLQGECGSYFATGKKRWLFVLRMAFW